MPALSPPLSLQCPRDAPGSPRTPAGHTVGGDQRVLHARGQLRLLAEHAHVADDAAAAAAQSWPARIGPDGIALHPKRKIALHVLDGIVLLGNVVDDVHAVGEWPGAQAHSQPLDAEDGPRARLVPGPEVVEDVDGRARGDAPAVGLGQAAEDARHDAEAGVGAHPERGGKARLEDAALARDPVVQVP